MSPEQCEPAPGVAPGFASDVFGLGATLFEAITGEPAYDEGVPGSDDIHERFPQVTDLPYGLPQRVPADVAKIVLACLAHDAADRPLPHEVAEALQPALERVPQGKLAGLRIR
jgi:serine/threonine protein kinase